MVLTRSNLEVRVLLWNFYFWLFSKKQWSTKINDTQALIASAIFRFIIPYLLLLEKETKIQKKFNDSTKFEDSSSKKKIKKPVFQSVRTRDHT